MGCGCTGGSTSVSIVPASAIRRVAATPVNCDYTPELLNEWKQLLSCVKTTNTPDLFNTSYKKINAGLGIVQSALNYSSFPCYFVPQLDGFKSLIDSIKQNNPC